MFKMIKCVFISLLCIYNCINADPIVTIKQGNIKGYVANTFDGRTIYSFLGIPYAKPPIGQLRFKDPEKADSWNGILDATKEGKTCIQLDFLVNRTDPMQGEEDCLYINVHTPNIYSELEEYPVLVFIHGGGWLAGKGSIYGPEYLLDQNDMILVTFNYRLGPLGFLSTEDVNSPGNYGLKDSIAALKWVKENIKTFNGDPDKVTIAGESAGAASVHYLLISPLSNGLFRAAISLSGTALASWASARQPALQAQRLAKVLNCPENPSSALIECLRGKKASDIVTGSFKLMEWNIDPVLIFSPTTEPKHSGQNVLPSSIIDLIRDAEKNTYHIPWMTGIITEDGAFRSSVVFEDEKLLADFSERFIDIAPITLRYRETASNIKDVSEKIKKFYFGNNKITFNSHKQATDMYTDRMFLSALDKSIDTMKAFNSKRKIYLYQFSYRGLHSYTDIISKNKINYGVCHLDELQYIFYMPSYKYPEVPRDENSGDYKMMKIMTELISKFVKTGKPTNEENHSFIWHPPNNLQEFADINLPKPKMLNGTIYSERRKFWKDLNLNEHRLPSKPNNDEF